MRVEGQPAFILHSRLYRETSLLVECLTRDHGRIGLVARGVRRERTRVPRALLQPLTPVQLGWNGRGELATLSHVEPVAASFDIQGDALLCALYLNELVLRLTPRQDPHPQVFADYLQTLSRLARGDALAWTLRRFERDLLAQLGYGLVLDVDADSGAPVVAGNEYTYRHESGPVPWTTSTRGVRLRGTALLALAHDESPAEQDLAALKRLMRGAIAMHLNGVDLRAWSVLAAAVSRNQADEAS